MIIWRPVKGYEKLYHVSNTGLVKKLRRTIHRSNKTTQTYPEKIIKQTNNRGYMRVRLSDQAGQVNSKYVHVLVANAFIPKNNDNLEVNHIDECKTNNNCNNLEWCTRSENIKHNNLHLRIAKKNKNGKCSRKVAQYDLEYNLVKIWDSFAEIGRNGFNHKNIHRTCQAKLGNKQTSGYYWSYYLNE